MTASPEEFAERLRSGGAAAMGSLPFADQVHLRHDPPVDSDGPIPGALLAAVSRAEADAMERALTTGLDRSVDVTVEGANLRVRSAVRGELTDGTSVDYATEVVLEVTDGTITAMEAHLDDASMAQHRAVLTAGGYERPA